MDAVPLEDYVEDITGKAQRGLGIRDAELLSRAGISAEALAALCAGSPDEETVWRVAPVLDLHPERLAVSARRGWYPEVPLTEGVHGENTPYGEMRVNAYVIWDPQSLEAAVFDTGADARGLIRFAKEHALRVRVIAITHSHIDHIADLDRLRSAYPDAAVYTGEREPVPGASPIAPGFAFVAGALQVSTRLTWGHARGGITYVVDGLERPVAVVGDALFAGSMGGGKVSYADALRTNREEILSLPDVTHLCPGHGPCTTVGQEKEHNPFF
ncbi:MAG TPA: MBL fold metallo-hydrolase [Verrucomicrobiales bacterium]|nr:MBL fold metallo-hydrolase [Verrucomicrobiales bacterium]